MKFGHLFEFHKIPEWYTEYVHYKDLRDQIDQFKKFFKEGLVKPLNGYYTINKAGQIYCIDFIKNFKEETTTPQQKRRALAAGRKSSFEDSNQQQQVKSQYDKPSPVKQIEVSRSASLIVQPASINLSNSSRITDEEVIAQETQKTQLDLVGLRPVIEVQLVEEEDQESEIISKILTRKVSDMTESVNAQQSTHEKNLSGARSARIRPVSQLTKQSNIDTLKANQDNYENPDPDDSQDQQAFELQVPSVIKPKDYEILMNQSIINQETLSASEELTALWISSYLDEINRVENFFNQKLNELINQFILMQDKFRLKAELYETEKQEKEAKRLKKEQEKNVPIHDKKQQLQSILDARLNYSTSNLDQSLLQSNEPYGTAAEGEEENQKLISSNRANTALQARSSSAIDSRKGSYSMVSPMGRSPMRTAETRGTMFKSAIEQKWKYSNRKDLEKYYLDVEGKKELDTFLVPDMEKIQEILQKKQITHNRRVKDEFDHMINWQRVFESIWMQIRWLKSYNQINELALKKILKKFMKNFFLIKDNTMNKKLESIIDEKEFKKKDKGRGAHDLKLLTSGVLKFYADMFCKSDVTEARRILDAQHNKIRTNDAVTMSFTAGGTLILLSFFIFFLILPQIGDEDDAWQELYSGIATYIFTFVMVFIIVATGVNIQIFRAYQINYAFIFEIDTKHKIIHHQLYRIGLVFFFMWTFCFVWQTVKIKIEVGFLDDYATFTLLCLLLFLLTCINPFPYFYSSTRLEILIALGNILVSPFGLVRFRHFFLADVLTSIITPLQQTMQIYCYFAGPEHDWKTSTPVNLGNGQCIGAEKISTTLGFLPYWWRLAQCLRKYKDSEQKVHLINAGKYFSDLLVPLVAVFPSYAKYDYNKTFYWYLGVHIFASTYSYAWDIYMDWGLLRSWVSPTYALRAKITYSPIFYYYAIVSDFLMRFFWVVTLFRIGGQTFNNFQTMTFISIMVECFRRAQWALIRVENEQNNNYEQYRTIPIIPPIVENDENSTPERDSEK